MSEISIVAYKCDLTVNKPVFQDIQPYGYTAPNQQGVAIYSASVLNAGTATKQVTLVGWGNSIAKATLTNVYFGVYADKTNVNISDVFGYVNNTGVYVTGAKYGSININNNTYNNVYTCGIKLLNNDPLLSSDVSYNTIVSQGGSAAIDIQEQNQAPAANQTVAVHHNKITMSGCLVGINLNSCSGNSTLPYNYKVYNNTITVGNANTSYSCISYSNCNNIESKYNLLLGSNATLQSIYGTGTPLGIQCSSSKCDMLCEKTSNTYTGLKFIGPCNDTRLQTNEMNIHTCGINITSGATLNNQGTTIESWGNRWTGTYPGTLGTNSYWGVNENSTLTRFYLKSGQLPEFGGNSTKFSPSTGWFFTSIGNPFICNTVQGAGYKNNEDENSDLTILDEQIINDSLQIDIFTEELKWQNEKIVYDKLKANLELIEPGTETEAFFESKQNSPTGILSNIEETIAVAQGLDVVEATQLDQLYRDKSVLIAQLLYADTLVDSSSTTEEHSSWDSITSSLNQRIETVNAQFSSIHQNLSDSRLQIIEQANTDNTDLQVSQKIEENQKMLNSIYLSTTAIGVDTFTKEQLDVLKYLAYQCPLSGGPAVYRSRSLLSIVKDTFYNDHEICAEAGIAYKKEKEDKSNLSTAITSNQHLNIRTYPNPANSYLLIQCDNVHNDPLTVRIYDVLGREVTEQSIDLSTKKYKLNTINIQSGLYYLKIANSKESLYSTKINIQH